MKSISNGEVYEFSGIYHLVLKEETGKSRKMFWCSLDYEQNINNLLLVNNYGLVTPREEWQYIGKVSESDYEQALRNFRARIEERYDLENKHSSKMSH